MALENSGLVVAMARRYAARGLDRADLLQEGQLGLMRAVDRFDPRLGYRFSTYAVWWVRHAMERAVRKQVALVRIPIPAHDASLRLRRLAAQTLAEHGRSPDEAELRAIGITPRQARRLELLPAASTTVPLEGHELEPHGVAPRALVDSACSADERVAAIELRALLGRALMRLPDRELAVLERRFALDGGAEETLQQIGKRMQLSRERIRQIEASALRRLRSALATA